MADNIKKRAAALRTELQEFRDLANKESPTKEDKAKLKTAGEELIKTFADRDGDGKITPEDLKGALADIQAVAAGDLNNDGVLTREEMAKISEDNPNLSVQNPNIVNGVNNALKLAGIDVKKLTVDDLDTAIKNLGTAAETPAADKKPAVNTMKPKEAFENLEKVTADSKSTDEQKKTAKAAAVTAMFDKDGDGKISADEMKKGAETLKAVNALDTNGNGKLSPAEAAAAPADLKIPRILFLGQKTLSENGVKLDLDDMAKLKQSMQDLGVQLADPSSKPGTAPKGKPEGKEKGGRE